MRRSTFLVTPSVLALSFVLVACGGPEKPADVPPAPTATTTAATTASTTATTTAEPAPAGDLLSQLKSSKLTLAQGVEQAEKDNGPAISAKFELEDGKLSLSVYTAKSGMDKDAEHNVLQELSGDPTKDKWQPKIEVFEDKAHITRAAMHLTLVQRAKTTLGAVIAKASAQQPGTVYSVKPAVKDKKPVFEVLVASPEGKSAAIVVTP